MNFLQIRRRDVHVIIGVVSDRVTCFDDLAEPINVFLFEDSTNGKEVHPCARFLDAPSGFHRVAFGFFVQIPFFVVPVRSLASWKIAAHFEIERDRDKSLAGARVQCFRFRRTRASRAQTQCRCGSAVCQETASREIRVLIEYVHGCRSNLTQET